jgi:uncharacterized protein (AIM24 family)
MDYTIIGYERCKLLFAKSTKAAPSSAKAGGLAWMSGNIAMNTNMTGGIGGLLRRVVSGESLYCG